MIGRRQIGWRTKGVVLLSLLLAAGGDVGACAQETSLPRIETQNGRHALFVDGKPYLMIAIQMHNSSAWPATLPIVWKAAESLGVNTVEAPVYWEQVEAQPGRFNFDNLDALLQGARQHRLHLVLLWFGTWKNARNHYTPEWIKTNPERYPRLIDANGRRTDSMSPFGEETLQADSRAFAELMKHLRAIDSGDRTVLMVQVENESGSLDSVRDFSPSAEKLFNAPIPRSLADALHLQPGTWTDAFGNAAAEKFQAWAVARYINRVAEAGKAEYPLPMYANVWVRSPDDLEAEGPRSYPSGGAVDTVLDLWKVAAPSLDMLSPDIYISGDDNYQRIADSYTRPDNPLFVPENSHEPSFARSIFRVIGNGGIGYGLWGVDDTNFTSAVDPAGHSLLENYAEFRRSFTLMRSMSTELAALEFDGKVKAVLEGEPETGRSLDFGKWTAIASFGVREEGEPQTLSGAHGALLVAQLSENEFLVTGFDARIEFHLAHPGKTQRWQILRVEEGRFVDGAWQTRRWLNGDECDFGVNFGASPQILRFTMGSY